MKIEEQNEKLVVSFNELEINNELMVENFIKWILKKDFFQQNYVYLCKWQSIKKPTYFQNKRGYLPDNRLKDKIIKKFSIEQAECTFYFAIFKISKEDFTVDFVLKHCFAGQLFSIKKHEQYEIILDEIESKLREDNYLLEHLNKNQFINFFDLNLCRVLMIKQFDNPTAGICLYTFFVI